MADIGLKHFVMDPLLALENDGHCSRRSLALRFVAMLGRLLADSELKGRLNGPKLV